MKFELGKWIENRRDGIKSRYNCKGEIDFFWKISCIRECKSLHMRIKSKPKQTRANSEETERKLKRKINRMSSVRIIVQTYGSS